VPLLPAQSTVKHQLTAEEARVQAAELVRKARVKREKEEAELARHREREVRAGGKGHSGGARAGVQRQPLTGATHSQGVSCPTPSRRYFHAFRT